MTNERGKSRDAAATEGDSPGAAAHAPGAPPSNTAPYNCNWSDDLVILRSGVDTLQLSYRGELYEEWQVRLAELKRLAQSEDAARRDLE